MTAYGLVSEAESPSARSSHGDPSSRLDPRPAARRGSRGAVHVRTAAAASPQHKVSPHAMEQRWTWSAALSGVL